MPGCVCLDTHDSFVDRHLRFVPQRLEAWLLVLAACPRREPRPAPCHRALAIQEEEALLFQQATGRDGVLPNPEVAVVSHLSTSVM